MVASNSPSLRASCGALLSGDPDDGAGTDGGAGGVGLTVGGMRKKRGPAGDAGQNQAVGLAGQGAGSPGPVPVNCSGGRTSSRRGRVPSAPPPARFLATSPKPTPGGGELRFGTLGCVHVERAMRHRGGPPTPSPGLRAFPAANSSFAPDGRLRPRGLPSVPPLQAIPYSLFPIPRGEDRQERARTRALVARWMRMRRMRMRTRPSPSAGCVTDAMRGRCPGARARPRRPSPGRRA
jgi:hypothetical protein